MQRSMTKCLSRFLLGFLCVLAVGSAVAIAACAGDGPASTSSGSASTSLAVGASKSVSFTTDDGVTLSGNLFGSGTSGVVQTPAPLHIAGVATLSAPVEFKGLSAAAAVPQLKVPLLFIAAEDDAGADGARELQEVATVESELELIPGDEHGTDLLEGPHGEQVWELLAGFVQQVLPATGG